MSIKDFNLHVTNCSYKCETLERIKVIQQRHNKTLQPAICLVTHLFYVNKCTYWYKTLQFHELISLQQAKCVVKDVNLQVKNYYFWYKTHKFTTATIATILFNSTN